MASAKTGIWSALGALVGGAAGVFAGRYAAQYRPNVRYYSEEGRLPSGAAVEDTMVVGGAAGAIVGAFLGGMLSGDDVVVAQGALPSNPVAGQLYSYTGQDGTPHTAKWNGTAWVAV